MAKSMSAAERRAKEAAKERKRNRLRGQIKDVQYQISSYDNEISSLESKLAAQRARKTLFDEECNSLDTEKAAKRIGAEISAQYGGNLKFALGYTSVMEDLLSGSTGQAYQNYRAETCQFMQMEIDENQARLEELQIQRSSQAAVMADLNYQLERI